MRALRRHTNCRWVLLYVERWLVAPVCMPDGALVSRDRGTPQGAVVSPILANLFLHYAFDQWMSRNHPGVLFERYADDVICHCKSEAQAEQLRAELDARLAACKLQLHPEKTKIVYCKDDNRRGSYPAQRFDFLGYCFRPRSSMNRSGALFVSFAPAVSDKAAKSMRLRMRRWRLHSRNDLELVAVAQWTRPVLLGWVRYYGRFRPSALLGPYVHWIRSLCVGLSANTRNSARTRCGHGIGCGVLKRSARPCSRIGRSEPRLDDRSCMSREAHVQFWEGLAV
ncbi:putative reverse transcriptase-group II intron [Burkholderia lata]|nr:putative reverse transcriptase-group II intron [Burkholderia lata]